MDLLPAIPFSPTSLRHSHLCSINPSPRTLFAPYFLRPIPISYHKDSKRSSSIAIPRASSGPFWKPSSTPLLPFPEFLEAPRPLLLQLATPAVFFFIGLGAARSCEVSSTPIHPPTTTSESSDLGTRKYERSGIAGAVSSTLIHPPTITSGEDNEDVGSASVFSSTPFHPLTTASESSDLGTGKHIEDDKGLADEFERWKSKTYALTVPLKIVALRDSVPAAWFKDFIRSQGRRVRTISEFRGSLNSIFSDLSSVLKTGRIEPKSTMSADIVSVGDSWLSNAISGGLIEPIQGVEEQAWFNDLSNRWKVFLCRNNKGELDSEGNIWGVPYRWGCMVIAYKKSKFRKHNLAPIEDWGDLWRPELAGKISMVDSPREIVGAVLKYMGASYNTKDIDLQVVGGRSAAMQNLRTLQRQVRLFDSVNYLKAFRAGDVWVAVGWSSDVLPAAKSMSNVAVIVPKSGASLWADLWAIPAATRFATNRIGGRVRSASPLVHQWIEFCLQDARGLPFQKELVPGASPFALERLPISRSSEIRKGPKLDTNLTGGVPPAEILTRCEFLEPLSENTLMDYQWLIAHMQMPGHGWIKRIVDNILSVTQKLRLDPHLK